MDDPRKQKKIDIDLDDLDDNFSESHGKVSIDLPPERNETVKTRSDRTQQSYYRSAHSTPPGYDTYKPAAGARSMPYPKADYGKRLVAFIIDVVIAYIPPVVMTFIINLVIMRDLTRSTDPFSGPSPLLALAPLLIFVIYFAGFIYFLIKDGLGKGQSIGKKKMGLMVVRLEDNQPCNMGNSFLRNIIISFIIPIEIIVALAVNENGYRLGDMAAKTQVIEVENYS